MHSIKIRADHEHGTDITLGQAIEFARGGRNEYGDRVPRVVVALTYAADTDGGKDWRGKPVLYKAGQPVFACQVEVHSRCAGFALQDACMSWATFGGATPADAKVWVEMISLASAITEAANAPRCAYCDGAGPLEPINPAGNLGCKDTAICNQRMAAKR
jgi:hypothetical protein